MVATMYALTAFVFCLLSSVILLLFTFLLLPWARQRLGSWALVIIPFSTFMGAYLGWMILITVYELRSVP